MGDSGQPLLGTNNGELRIEYDNGRLIVSDQGTDLMLAGKDPEGRVVVKISEPGVDVKTATDDQLIFNSDQQTFKIYKKGTVSVGPTSTTDTKTVLLKGYDRTPVCLAFVKVMNYSSSLPSFNFATGAAGGYAGVSSIVYCNVDQIGSDGRLQFAVTRLGPGSDPNVYDITYYVLQENFL